MRGNGPMRPQQRRLWRYGDGDEARRRASLWRALWLLTLVLQPPRGLGLTINSEFMVSNTTTRLCATISSDDGLLGADNTRQTSLQTTLTAVNNQQFTTTATLTYTDPTWTYTKVLIGYIPEITLQQPLYPVCQQRQLASESRTDLFVRQLIQLQTAYSAQQAQYAAFQTQSVPAADGASAPPQHGLQSVKETADTSAQRFGPRVPHRICCTCNRTRAAAAAAVPHATHESRDGWDHLCCRQCNSAGTRERCICGRHI